MPDAMPPSTTESPATTPESPTPTSPSSPSSPDDFGFEGGDRGGELDEASIFADIDEVPPAPEAAPVQPPAQQTPKPVSPPAEPPAQPVQGPGPQAEQLAPALDPQQLVQQFRQWRADAENVLSNSHYNLTAEDANQINIDPGQVIPKLMSRVYLDAVTAAVNVIAQSLPYTVMNTIDAHNGYQRNEDEFFGEWPGLRDHGSEVVRIGQVFRHLNPKASKADFIRSVGAQAALALGLTAEQARGTPMRQQPGQRVLRHVPPAASARHAPAQPARPANIFEQMAQDTQEDD